MLSGDALKHALLHARNVPGISPLHDVKKYRSCMSRAETVSSSNMDADHNGAALLKAAADA
jgi:hypothetical protein